MSGSAGQKQRAYVARLCAVRMQLRAERARFANVPTRASATAATRDGGRDRLAAVRAEPPRQSIAFAVRAADAGRSHLEHELAAMHWADVFEPAAAATASGTVSDRDRGGGGDEAARYRCKLNTATRLRLVVKGLLLFKWWFGDGVPEAALPAPFWRGLRSALSRRAGASGSSAGATR